MSWNFFATGRSKGADDVVVTLKRNGNTAALAKNLVLKTSMS